MQSAEADEGYAPGSNLFGIRLSPPQESFSKQSLKKG